MEIAGRTFLVTGGSGLGAATVRGLADAGAKILIADLNEKADERLGAELGETARFVRTDVTDEKSAHAAIDTAVHEIGGLHGVVNCAGIVIAGKVLGKNGPHELDSLRKSSR